MFGIQSRAKQVLMASRKLTARDDLLSNYQSLKGENIASSQLVNRAFSLAIAACRRIHQLEHYPVQVLAGLRLIRNEIVEMQTGEGKTLTAILPLAYRALAGKSCHVLTANDYLAKRDCEFAAPILAELGKGKGVRYR